MNDLLSSAAENIERALEITKHAPRSQGPWLASVAQLRLAKAHQLEGDYAKEAAVCESLVAKLSFSLQGQVFKSVKSCPAFVVTFLTLFQTRPISQSFLAYPF